MGKADCNLTNCGKLDYSIALKTNKQANKQTPKYKKTFNKIKFFRKCNFLML